MHKESIDYTKGSWVSMVARCKTKKMPTAKSYFNRGIKVCSRWENSFDDFLSDMGIRPPGAYIDRINNDGNYEPGNCRWVTPRENCRNHPRIKLSMKKAERIRSLNKNGMSIEDIAAIFIVHPQTIKTVIAGKSWVPLTDAEKQSFGRGEI